MEVKSYIAPDLRQAMRLARMELGSEAVIISQNIIPEGVELTVGVVEKPEVEILHAQHGASEVISSIMEMPHEDVVKDNQIKLSPSVTTELDPSLSNVREELNFMRTMLEKQLSSMIHDNRNQADPSYTFLKERLTELGFDHNTCKKITNHINQNNGLTRAWQETISYLHQAVPVVQDNLLEQGGVVCLLGPTGVGKTTTIAKLATCFALRNDAQKLGIITADSYRVASQEQLVRYGSLLGVSVYAVQDSKQLKQVLSALKNKHLVLIDTAGIGHKDKEHLAEQEQLLLHEHDDIKFYLTLSATTQTKILYEIVTAYKLFKLSGCIITKVDENAALSSILNIPINFNLPIAYVSNGQRVPQDIKPAQVKDIIDMALSVTNDTEEQYIEPSVQEEQQEVQHV